MKCCKKSEEDGKGECCAKVWRWLLLASGSGAIMLSIFTSLSCDFMNVSYDKDSDPAKLPYNDTLDFNIGLWRFEPDGDGCQAYPNNLDKLDVELATARIAGFVAIVFAFIGLAFLWIECVCCRFCGARLLQTVFLLGAAVSQGCTFLLFGSQICTIDLSKSYPCSLAEGGIFSITSCITYLASSMLICCTFKPEPICVSLQEQDHNDPCCCRKKKVEAGEESDEEQPPDDPVEPAEPAEVPVVPHAAAVVVVGYGDDPSFLSTRDLNVYGDDSNHSLGEGGHTMETLSHWPSQEAKKDYARKSGTYATLPPYRDVAFIDSEAFFDADVQQSTKKS